MKKLLLIGLGLGAAMLLQKRFAKSGIVPAALAATLAEKGLEYLNTLNPPPPSKPSLWQKLFGPAPKQS
jgi:hypothetical protein